MKYFIFLSALVLLSCSPKINFDHHLSEAEKKFKDNTGFMLYDPARGKTLASYNAAQYFTPASNTKILTLYTSLRILGDSIPAFRYISRNDSVILWGTGDPSFLNPSVFNNNQVYNFLQKNPNRLFINTTNFHDDVWGQGWAWDDFGYSYSSEKTPVPVYGNVMHVVKERNKLKINPVLFQSHFLTGDTIQGKSKLVREMDSNQVTWLPGNETDTRISWDLPFHYSSDLIADILSDTLKRQVDEITIPQPTFTQTLFSIPSDSLYSVMMKFSDNHIAEQLLLLCANKISDSLRTEIAISYARKKFLGDLPDQLAWVDGSGLSRYNLTTPRNIVKLWEKLYKEFPRDRLFQLLAIGGQKGTLKNYYSSVTPYIFGKTGSLSNNSSLSGFLITKKGSVLIFSFMNGNYIAPSNEIRLMMQDLLNQVRNKY
jgi:serine-type D-Ala-D-Ala carboxypeptidase/endopeptidase (penicillin-binding protein 4)